MKRLRICMLVAIALISASGLLWAQTTVPHTFSAGTTAKAAEVNANFQALATAIDGLGGGTPTAVSGYGFSYGSGETPGNRNVWVYRYESRSDALIYYDVWSWFRNGVVKKDGTTDTTFSYVEEYTYVSDDPGGVGISGIVVFRDGTDDPPGGNRTYYRDHRLYDTSGTLTSITSDLYGKHYWLQPKGDFLNMLTPVVEVYFGTSSSSSPARVRDRSRLYIDFPGSLTLNGITYTDVLVRLEPGVQRRRLVAKGIGILYRDDNYDLSFGEYVQYVPTLIYARIDGTEYGPSNLTGTPFEPGTGTLAGVWF